MMTNELARVESAGKGVDLATAPFTHMTLQAIANTEFLPRGLRGNLPAALACVMAGRELGLGPMESLQKIDVIDGKPSPSAELLVAMVFRAGHSIFPKEITPTSATAYGRRSAGEEFTFTFTIEDAQRAGLAGKANWKGYPGPMLYWRAASQLCRIFFPDVLTSFRAYTPDEMGDSSWEPPAPTMEVAEEGHPFLPADPGGEPMPVALSSGFDLLDAEAEAEAYAQTTSSPSEVSVGEAVANFETILDAEVVDEEAEKAWDDLLKHLSLDAGAGTIPQIEQRCRNLCSLMEVNGLWPADSLHSLLQRWVQVEHWADLKNKATMIKFAQAVADAAEKKVAAAMKEKA